MRRTGKVKLSIPSIFGIELNLKFNRTFNSVPKLMNRNNEKIIK